MFKLNHKTNLFVVFSLILFKVNSQTLIIDPTADGGFEGSHGWTILNTTNVNKWIVGTAAKSAGSSGAYISNNNSASAITNPQASNSRVYIYKDVIVPNNANSISISFKYKNSGTDAPAPRCMFALASAFPALPTDGSSYLVGAEFATVLNNASNWVTYNNTSPLSSDRPITYTSQTLIPGATYRIIFEWGALCQTCKVQTSPICSYPSAANITGNFSITPGTTMTFGISSTGGANFGYDWSVTAGASISSGQGTNSVNVYFPSNYTGGNIRCQLTCPTPVFANSGTTGGAIGIDEVSVSYVGRPIITSFSPSSGAVGSSVTIVGQNFGATTSDNIVYLGGMKCNITAASSSSITVSIPPHSSVGEFTVINKTLKLNATSQKDFITTNSSLSNINYAAYAKASFDSIQTFTTVTQPQSINQKFINADIDGDNKIDIVTMSNAGVPQVWRNTSTSGVINSSSLTASSISSVSPTITSATVINAFDYNNDGLIDIAATNGISTQNGFVNINNSTSGTPSFKNFSSLLSSSNHCRIGNAFLPIDINNDGRTDILGTDNSTGLTFSLNNTNIDTFKAITGNASNTNSINQLLANGGQTGASGDLNNDGMVDLVIGGNGLLNILQNTTKKGAPVIRGFNFKEIDSKTAGSLTYNAVKIADLDGDGKLDVIAGSSSSLNLLVFKNNTIDSSDISMSEVSNFATDFSNSQISSIALGDMNGDGKVDILVGNSTGNLGIGYFENISSVGTINFAPFVRLVSSGYYHQVELADIDGDNKLDIVASGGPSSTNVSAVTVLSIFRNRQGEAGVIGSNQTICTGTIPAPFTSLSAATLPSGTPQYQWQSSTTANFTSPTTISGATSETYTHPTALTTTTYFRRRVNSSLSTGNFFFSNPIMVAITASPSLPTSVRPDTACGTNAVTLRAVPSTGNTVAWYAATSGGSPLALGDSFITPSLSANTIYYAGSLTSNGCLSASRTAVTAVIFTTVPTVGATAASRCDAGPLTLSGTVTNRGTLRWYNVASGGTILNTGLTYNIPNLTTTTTYFVEGNNCNGNTATRTAVTATVTPTPQILTTTPVSACRATNAIINATASSGNLSWFADSITTSSSGSGASFTVGAISATTRRFVSSSITTGSITCTSPRVGVTATMVELPSPPANVNATLCGTGTATLSATPPSGGFVEWYSASTGGTLLGSNSTYTTPVLSSNTTYFVRSINSFGCASSTRTPDTVKYNGPNCSILINTNALTNSTNNTIVASTISNFTSYIWQRSTDGSNWVDITSNLDPGVTYSGFSGTTGTSSTMTISSAISNMHGYQYRLKLTQGAGCEFLSNAATFRVADLFGSCNNTTALAATYVQTSGTSAPQYKNSCSVTMDYSSYPPTCDPNTYWWTFGNYNPSQAAISDGNGMSGVVLNSLAGKAFITLDLGSPKVINKVYLLPLQEYNSNNCCSLTVTKHMDCSDLWVSNDSVNWTTIYSCLDGGANPSAGGYYDGAYTSFSPVTARYVRLHKNWVSGNEGLAEFKVYPLDVNNAPYIRTLPPNMTVSRGSRLNIPVDVTTPGGGYTFQWKYTKVSNGVYANEANNTYISGVNTSTYNNDSFFNSKFGFYKLDVTSYNCSVSATSKVDSFTLVYYSSNAGSAALQTLSSWNTGVTGTGGVAPSDFGNGKIFVLANSAAQTYSNGTAWTNNGTLKLNKNILTIGNFDAYIDTVVDFTNSAYIRTNGTGVYRTEIFNSGTKTMPVGNTTYNPVIITNKTGSTDTFSVRIADAVLSNGSSGTAMNNVVNRTWTILKKNTNAAPLNSYGVDLTFKWLPNQVVGTVSYPVLFAYVAGTGWVQQSAASTSFSDSTITYSGYKGTLNNTMFMLSNPAPTITSFSPTFGGLGTVDTIFGTNLSNPTAVSYGGTPATSFYTNSGALNFDGINDYVAIKDTSVIDLTTNYTLECWIKVDSFVNSAGIISKFNSASSNGYILKLSQTSPFTGIYFDGMTSANGILEKGNWYHIAAVKSGTTRTLYINGVVVPMTGTAITTVANTDSLVIGADRLNNLFFNGTIDEVRLWSIANNQATIQANMKTEVSSTNTNLIAYYTFNNLTSNVLVDQKTPSKNGNLLNLALSGSKSNWVQGYFMPTRIIATLGSGATGAVSLTTLGGSSSLSTFTYFQAPKITYFTPTKTNQGKVVSIYGNNFNNATAVSFGGTAALSYTVVSNNQINATLRTGTTGFVKVTTPGGADSLVGFTFGIPYDSLSVLAGWNPSNTSSQSYPMNANYTNSNIVTASAQNQSGLTAVNHASNSWINSNNSGTLDINTAPYLSYSIITNKSVKFDRFVLPGLKSTSSKLQLRWDVDNYATSLGEFVQNNNGNNTLTSEDLTGTLTQPADTIMFRIYFYNGNNDTITMAGGTGYSTLDGTAPITYDAMYSAYVMGANKPIPSLSGFNNIIKNISDIPFTLGIPSSNSLGVFSFSLGDTSIASISGSRITLKNTGISSITATQAETSDYGSASVSSNLIVKTSPFLFFPNINKYTGSGVFDLYSTRSSNGAFTYKSSNTASSTISGNTATPIANGLSVFTLNQDTSGVFNADSVKAVKTVSSLSLYNVSYRLNPLINKTLGDPSFNYTTGLSNNSNGTTSYYNSNPKIASMSSVMISLITPGVSILSIGNLAGTYNAGSVSSVLVVSDPNKTNPIIGTLPNYRKKVTDGAFKLSPPTSNSNGDFYYVSSNPSIAFVKGDSVFITGSGQCHLVAIQNASANYNEGAVFDSLFVSPTITYNNQYTFTRAAAISSIIPTLRPAELTTYRMFQTLPRGLSFATATGVISGTPSVTSVNTRYYVIDSNSGGKDTVSFLMRIVDPAPTAIAYTTPNVYTVGTSITTLFPTFTGIVDKFTVSPSLPSGLTLDSITGEISGTPSAAKAQTTYVVTASNTGGSISCNVVITVNDQGIASLQYPTPNILAKGVSCDTIRPSVSGGAVTLYTISPSLPSGLILDTLRGIIYGTPVAANPTLVSYIVTAMNNVGSLKDTFQILINDEKPTNLQYTTPDTFYTCYAITPLTPTNQGGVATSYSISPSLPAGLTFNTSTGVISGTPLNVDTALKDYEITALNFIGFSSKTIQIRILSGTPTITSNTSVTRCGSGSITLNALATNGTIKWYSSANSNIPLDSGNSYTPNINTTTTYYIEATDFCGTGPRVSITASIIPLATITGMDSIYIDNYHQLSVNKTKHSNTPWQSSNSSKITVDNNGKLFGNTLGLSTITFVDSLGCQQSKTIEVIEIQWTGNSSTDFNTGNNWSGRSVPDTIKSMKMSASASNDMKLTRHMRIGTIDFNGSNKKIDLHNYDLTIDTIVGYNANNHIKFSGSGKMKRSILSNRTFIFPVGNSSYNPISIKNKTGVLDTFAINLIDSVFLNGISGVSITNPHVKRTWNISKNNANTGAGVDMIFNWNSGDIVGTLVAPTMNHHTGTHWEIPTSGTASVSGNSLTYSGYTGTFSPFAIGGSMTVALPIELIAFNAKCTNDFMQIQWTTASEKNNKMFELYKSDNAIDWNLIHTTDGQGDKASETNYQFMDNDKKPAYYRLKDIDFDGIENWSQIIFADCKSNTSKTEVYPNPASDYIKVTTAIDEKTTLRIVSIDGRILKTLPLVSEQTLVDIKTLVSGVYIVEIKNQKSKTTFKINKI
jgi:hypothetical protein